MARQRKTTESFSYMPIDDVIRHLEKLKKEGYTTIEEVRCICYNACNDCACSSFVVSK